MRYRLAAFLLASGLVAAAALVLRLTFVKHDPMPQLPRIVLWAWERPEKLGFIDPARIGVAFLDRTLWLRGDAVVVRPRLQPLEVPPGTKLIAVARIESAVDNSATLSAGQRSEAVSALAEMAGRPGLAAIQIDFDATVSERGFYAELLRNLRQRLPEAMPITITALSSWCLGDHWLEGMPVTDAIPMLFRMGPDEHQVRIHLAAEREFRPECRASVGISTDEPMPRLPLGRRVYIFHPRPWSAVAVERIVREVRSWQ